MKIEKPNKPEEMSIFVPDIGPNRELVDFRLVQRYGGITFGTISQVANNLGVKMKKVEGGLTFTAPKARLQMFVEKLHFAMIKYR